MKKYFILLLTAATLFSCKVSQRNIAGTYQLNSPSRTKLVLKEDKTFEFVKNFSEPGPIFFPDSTEFNYRTDGKWELGNNGSLILNSFPDQAGTGQPMTDSLTRTDGITSFSFWNQYGDAVNIRFMKFPPDKVKLFKANIISFFAEDFNSNDSLEFHFYGYPPLKWPEDFPGKPSGSLAHRITLYEQQRNSVFKDVELHIRRNKLLAKDKSFALYKKD